jgi:hypothetical protein
MHATMNTATAFGEEYGTIVNTVTPIVASILQSRQPYGGFGSPGLGAQGWAGAQGWVGFGQQGGPGGFGQPGLSGGFGQRAGLEELGPIVAAVLASLQGHAFQQPYLQQPYLPGLQPYFSAQQPFAGQSPYRRSVAVRGVPGRDGPGGSALRGRADREHDHGARGLAGPEPQLPGPLRPIPAEGGLARDASRGSGGAPGPRRCHVAQRIGAVVVILSVPVARKSSATHTKSNAGSAPFLVMNLIRGPAPCAPIPSPTTPSSLSETT